MNAHDWYLSIISGERGAPDAVLMRAFLQLLSWPFAGLTRLRYQAYRLGLLPSQAVPATVISVGNLAAGGTGKTSLVLLLVRAFQERGITVGIAARACGPVSVTGPVLVSDGRRVRLTPREAGDEPYLLVKELPGVAMAVDQVKARAAQLLCREVAPAIIVVDDGMQHLRLRRSLDVVLLDARQPFGNGFVLPRGLLREPPSALRRAGIIVLTRAQGVPGLEEVRRQLAQVAPGVPVFTADLAMKGMHNFRTGEQHPTSFLAGKRAVMLSGIGNPAAFEATVEECCPSFTVRYRLPDHHAYTPQDMIVLRRLCAENQMDCVVTTAKDAVKLADVLDVPVPVLVLQVALAMREADFVDVVLRWVGR